MVTRKLREHPQLPPLLVLDHEGVHEKAMRSVLKLDVDRAAELMERKPLLRGDPVLPVLGQEVVTTLDDVHCAPPTPRSPSLGDTHILPTSAAAQKMWRLTRAAGSRYLDRDAHGNVLAWVILCVLASLAALSIRFTQDISSWPSKA